VRYRVWRSNKDKELHLLCAEGAEAFEALPTAIRNLGPWTGSKEGEVDRLRLPYRTMLTEHGFTIVYAHISKLNLEAPCGPKNWTGVSTCSWCNVACARKRLSLDNGVAKGVALASSISRSQRRCQTGRIEPWACDYTAS